MLEQWPLVGRIDELELVHAIELAGRRRGVILSGPAGVGKTRLATEVLASAAAEGRATAWVSATRAVASVPFGAFAPLLPPASVVAGHHPLDVLRCVADELAGRSDGRGPVTVGIDDAHLLDDASAAVVHLLAAKSVGFVVATVRRGEAAPDPVVALWKDGLAERVEVQALAASEVAELLSVVLGGHVDTATHHRLWDATQGNVLFLRELLRHGLERGALAERGGVWSWDGPLGAGARLTELVEARLAGLADVDRQLLEELAVGEPLAPGLLGAGRLDLLGRLEERGLVTVLDEGRRAVARLSHPLYAECLRSGMGVIRRRAVQRRLADALSVTGCRRRLDLLRLTTLQVDGGGPLEPVTLVEGARQAQTLADHRLAERLARRSLEEAPSTEASLVLGDALYWQGRHLEAQQVLDAAAKGATGDAQLATSAIARSSNLFWGLGRGAEAQHLLREVLDHVEDLDWRDELSAHLASLQLFGGQVEDARVAAEAVLYRPGAGERAQARALATTIPAWALVGRPESAAAMAAVAIAILGDTATEHPSLVAELLQGQAVAYWLAGRLDEMEELATAGYRAAVERAADDFRGPWALLLGRAALARGSAAVARNRLREAAALLRTQDIGGFLPWCLAAGAQACALVGDLPGAEEALVEVRRRRLDSVRIHHVEVVLAHAWVKASEGERSAATVLAGEAADAAAGAGMRIMEALARHDALRLGGGAEAARRLVAVTGGLEGALAPALAEHAEALLARDAVRLDGAAGRFAALGMPLLAAEVAAEVADLHRLAGRTSSQVTALARSRAWADACGTVRTPILISAEQAPDLQWLTRREREIVELAARGLTKRQIADRLVVSIRTVGNHLNHAYAKLGVSRDDLERLLDLDTGRNWVPPGS